MLWGWIITNHVCSRGCVSKKICFLKFNHSSTPPTLPPYPVLFDRSPLFFVFNLQQFTESDLKHIYLWSSLKPQFKLTRMNFDSLSQANIAHLTQKDHHSISINSIQTTGWQQSPVYPNRFYDENSFNKVFFFTPSLGTKMRRYQCSIFFRTKFVFVIFN